MSPSRHFALGPALAPLVLVLLGLLSLAPDALAANAHRTAKAKPHLTAAARDDHAADHPAAGPAAGYEEHTDGEAHAAPADHADATHADPAHANDLAHANGHRSDHAEHAADDKAGENHATPGDARAPPPNLTAEERAAYDPELDVDMTKAPSATDHEAYGDFLRLALQKVRPKVMEKLQTKMIASQEKAMGRFSAGLSLFATLGFLLVFRPLFLLKKHPGQGKKLFGYGVLSAFLFYFAVNLFAAVLGLLRFAQGAAGRITNPQVAVVEAAFDVLERNADDLAVLGPKLIEPSLHKLAAGDADFVVVLLENLQSIKGDVKVILAIAKGMKALDGVLAWIPIVLTVVAVVTFAISAKTTLLAIVRLPESAVIGGGAKDVVKLVLRRVKGELFATLCLVGMLIVVTLLAGMALRAAVEPAVEAFLSTVFLAAMYIQTEKVSSLVLFGSLGLAAMVLVLNMGVVMAASTAALGKMHKIFQRKFHEGLPLSAHGRFWKRAPLALLVCFVFPIVYDTIAEKGVEKIMEHALESKDPSYATALVGAPALLVGGFIVAFAAVLGVHAILFLFKYPVNKIAMPAYEAEIASLALEGPDALPPSIRPAAILGAMPATRISPPPAMTMLGLGNAPPAPTLPPVPMATPAPVPPPAALPSTMMSPALPPVERPISVPPMAAAAPAVRPPSTPPAAPPVSVVPVPSPTFDDLAIFDALQAGRPKAVAVAPLVTSARPAKPSRLPSSSKMPVPSAAMRNLVRSSRPPLPMQIPPDAVPPPQESETDMAKTNVFHRSSTNIPSIDATIQMPTFADQFDRKGSNDSSRRA